MFWGYSPNDGGRFLSGLDGGAFHSLLCSGFQSDGVSDKNLKETKKAIKEAKDDILHAKVAVIGAKDELKKLKDDKKRLIEHKKQLKRGYARLGRSKLEKAIYKKCGYYRTHNQKVKVIEKGGSKWTFRWKNKILIQIGTDKRIFVRKYKKIADDGDVIWFKEKQTHSNQRPYYGYMYIFYCGDENDKTIIAGGRYLKSPDWVLNYELTTPFDELVCENKMLWKIAPKTPPSSEESSPKESSPKGIRLVNSRGESPPREPNSPMFVPRTHEPDDEHDCECEETSEGYTSLEENNTISLGDCVNSPRESVAPLEQETIDTINTTNDGNEIQKLPDI